MRIVWTERKLKSSGTALLNKLIMLAHLHKDKEGSLLLIIKGGSASVRLLEQSLRDVSLDTLFTLSDQPYGKLFPQTEHNSYYDSGFNTLESCIKDIIREKCRFSVSTGLDYIKWGMQRKASSLKVDPVDILGDNLLRDSLIKTAAAYALESGPWHVNSFLHCMDKRFLQAHLPVDFKVRCIDMVYQEVMFEDLPEYTIDHLLDHLIEDGSLLPNCVQEYGLSRIESHVSTKAEHQVLRELRKLLPSKKVPSII